MYAVLVLGLLMTPLVVAVGKASLQEHDTVRCYGTRLERIIGGDAVLGLQTDFSCPSCVQPQLCSAEHDLCLRLSSEFVHVFKGSGLSQSLPLPSGCHAPLRIVESESGVEYYVHCESRGPLYQPVWFSVYNEPGTETGFEADEADAVRNRLAYAQLSDNTILTFDEYHNMYQTSLLDSTNEIAVVYDTSYLKAVPGCVVNQRLFAGSVTNGNLEAILDCNTTEGALARQRVSISLTDLRTADSATVEPLHPPLPSDTVKVSPGRSYILYVGTSRLVVIETSQTSRTPGIVDFPFPIDQAEFLSDTVILLSLPGQRRTVIKLEEFFATSFSRGMYELSDSVAYCPLGSCQPFVVDGDKLFLFTEDQPPSSYLVLTTYNISDLFEEPTRITRTRRDEQYDICLPTVANITVLLGPTTEPPTVFTSPPITLPLKTPPLTTPTETGVWPETERVPSDDPRTIVAVLCTLGGVIVLVAVAVAVVIIVVLCHSSKKWLKKHDQKRSAIIVESARVKLETLVVGTSSKSPGTSTNTSSSTISLNMSDVTTAHQETVLKHYLQPTPSMVSQGIAGTTQRV